MSAIKIIQSFAKKFLTKDKGSGITTLPSQFMAESKAGEIAAILQKAGIPINQLDDFIRSEADVAKFLNIIEATNKPKVYSGQAAIDQLNKIFPKKGEVVDMTGKKIDTSQGIMGGKSVKELMESGQVQKGTDELKVSDKVTEREMFKNSNLNKKDSVTDTITYIKTLEPMDAMKEANSVIGRKGKYKNLTPEESKKILTDTEDHIFERDIPDEDFASGGRAGFYTGGITDVEPSLDDIGHGSDALMARTRLMSPGAQATTSTGLNYLLAEDNDNMRIPFAKGKIAKEVADKGRRGFMKAAGATGAGIAALKTGLLGFADKAAPVIEKTAEAVSNTAGQVPAYFLNLVKKIKNLGDDAPRLATQDRQKVTTYKDYTLTEDVATGRQEIQRMKVLDDDSASYYGQPLTEETYMSYTPGETLPGKGKIKPLKTADEYEEGTALLRSDRGNAGEIVEESATISDDVIEEGTKFEDNLSDFGKADGGRIGMLAGGGILKAVLKNSADAKGMTVRDFIMAMNPKSIPSNIKNLISKVDLEQLKAGYKDYYENISDMMKTRFDFQKGIEGGKTTPAKEMFEDLERTMDKQSYVPKNVTQDDIAKTELMIKNKFNKGRKDNAQGGLQTMLGE